MIEWIHLDFWKSVLCSETGAIFSNANLVSFHGMEPISDWAEGLHLLSWPKIGLFGLSSSLLMHQANSSPWPLHFLWLPTRSIPSHCSTSSLSPLASEFLGLSLREELALTRTHTHLDLGRILLESALGRPHCFQMFIHTCDNLLNFVTLTSL